MSCDYSQESIDDYYKLKYIVEKLEPKNLKHSTIEDVDKIFELLGGGYLKEYLELRPDKFEYPKNIWGSPHSSFYRFINETYNVLGVNLMYHECSDIDETKEQLINERHATMDLLHRKRIYPRELIENVFDFSHKLPKGPSKKYGGKKSYKNKSRKNRNRKNKSRKNKN